MDEKAFLGKLADILQVDSLIVQPEFNLNLGNWDSFAIMETIALIDEYLGITVPATELAHCQTVEALMALIHRNQQK